MTDDFLKNLNWQKLDLRRVNSIIFVFSRELLARRERREMEASQENL